MKAKGPIQYEGGTTISIFGHQFTYTLNLVTVFRLFKRYVLKKKARAFQLPLHFTAKELVCNHIYAVYGEFSIKFIDTRLYTFITWFREAIGREVYVNFNGMWERGFRCNLCEVTQEHTRNNVVYISSHLRFQAIDCNVKGMTDEQVVQWLENNKKDIPVKIRIEKGTKGWTHIDVSTDPDTTDKITYF